MLKRCVFLLFLFCFTNQCIFSNIKAINLEKLPRNDDYRSGIKWIVDNQHLVAAFWPRWDFKPPKDDVIKKIKKLIEQTDTFILIDKKNIDLLLLRVLLYHYLYNLDLSEYDDKIVTEANRIKGLFPEEYRIYWLIGHHYDKHGLGLQAMKEYEYVLNNADESKLKPYFWYDYAEATGPADMLKHGIEAFKKYSSLEKRFKMVDNEMYQMFVGHFIAPSMDSEISLDDVYTCQQRENSFGILCRLFGIYMPINKEWSILPYKIKDNGSLIMFTPESIMSKKKKNIKYTILVEYEAGSKLSFEDFIEYDISRYTNYKKKDMAIGAYPFKMYETTDPDVYVQMGGAHGVLLFLSRKEPVVKGLNVEAPIQSFFDEQTHEPYARPVQEYDRYDGVIYYSILLDCCEEIFDDAFIVFKSFVDKLVFD